MDQKTLLIFAKRILSNGSDERARLSLQQLQKLLTEQGASQGDIALIKKMIMSIPEMKDAARKPVLTEVDVQIAARRAAERKAREEAARQYSRC